MKRTGDASDEIVWRPSPEHIENAHLTHFMRQNNVASFEELIERSGSDVAWFTDALLQYLDIRFRVPYSKVVDLSRGIEWPRWCVDGRMNIVDNCLDKHIGTELEDQRALVWEGEEGETRTLTYGELARQVSKAANALRSLGLGKGDAIGLYMPMTPEVVIALLAIAKIGGIILPLFSGYGAGAVASRLIDGEAKALFAADGFFRRGQLISAKPTADEALSRVPNVKHVIVLQRAKNPVPMQAGRDHWWHELVDRQPDQAETEDTSAEDVLMIIYTSGTTGRPKGAVHTHCGFPIKATQDAAFGVDVHQGDLVYWMTDMGWMMGPWLTFAPTLLGAAMFIYDGAPDYPGPDRLWAMIERHGVNILGLSPTLVRSLQPLGEEPVRAHDLSSLRLIGSTGEPWNPDPWMWLFETVCERKRPIINYTGGTELSGGIAMGNPIQPVKPCAFSGPCPGVSADVLDENGKPVREQVGELVIKSPWIGMTRGFWKDPKRYEETYWSRWPNVWIHGDWAMIDEDGMWYVYGRSDDTIKVAGKRLGPAEVESVLVGHPAVVEAAAIGVPDEIKGSALVCFCVLGQGVELDDALASELRERVIAEMGKPLAPKAFYAVDELPQTRNAKVMRRMIRSAFLGDEAGDTSALVNPHSLKSIAAARKTSSD
jgi:acetyl-CoA synthetase